MYRKRNIDGIELFIWIKENRCKITENDCWLWQGSCTDRGYGNVKYKNRTWRIHRLMWILHGNKFDDEMELDHTCKNITCCNPNHLEQIVHSENVQRGNLKYVSSKVYGTRTHCPKGHAYSGNNLYVDPKNQRRCRQCARDRYLAQKGIL
jgi:hypothetical protein